MALITLIVLITVFAAEIAWIARDPKQCLRLPPGARSRLRGQAQKVPLPSRRASSAGPGVRRQEPRPAALRYMPDFSLQMLDEGPCALSPLAEPIPAQVAAKPVSCAPWDALADTAGLLASAHAAFMAADMSSPWLRRNWCARRMIAARSNLLLILGSPCGIVTRREPHFRAGPCGVCDHG
jgi:hypothetical protein